MFWEYAGFFHAGMVTRNERNAIIQHGTMTLIRKSALIDQKGWAEWCITEDSQLGLRLFRAGYEAVYSKKSFGKGVMPDDFTAFRKQRYRWAYGAMRIVRANAAALFNPFNRELTGLALSHSIGKAVWKGLFSNSLPFLRTPKMKNAPAMIQGLVMAREEFVLLALTWAALLGVGIGHHWATLETKLWCAVLFTQSLPYLASVSVSILAAMPAKVTQRLPIPATAKQPVRLGAFHPAAGD